MEYSELHIIFKIALGIFAITYAIILALPHYTIENLFNMAKKYITQLSLHFNFILSAICTTIGLLIMADIIYKYI